MRIVFFGTPDLAVPSLRAVAAAHEVTALVCRPDRPQGRSKKPVSPPTKVWAQAQGIETMQPSKLNDGTFEAWLKSQRPEICVLVAYGRILKQPLLDVPAHGFLNLHPSLLPRHRGPSPIQTAILQGDTETGVTIMRLDAGTDTGDVLTQDAIPIDPDDTAKTLAHKLAELGAAMVVSALERIENQQAVFVKQDDSLATHTRIVEKDDGRIHWHMRATDIHNLVRACVPWPVAHCRFAGDTIRIHKTRVVPANEGVQPGQVLRVEKTALIVAAGEDALSVEVLQAAGKKAMPVGDFLRGAAIRPGDRFEDL